jgi:hypothetical protein
MNLLLTLYQTPAWNSLIEQLSLPETNLLKPVQTPAELQQLSKKLEQNQTLWIGYVQAEHHLANAVEQGKQLNAAAKEWQQITQTLLTQQAQNRQQLKLFNIHQALINPETLTRCLLTGEVQPTNHTTSSDSLSLLAACQYVAQTEQLRQLNLKLQASALPLAESESLSLDIEAILLQNQSALEKTKKECQDALDELKAKNKNLESALKETSEERDLILQQLHLVQEELERYYNQIKEQEQQHKHALLARDKQHARDITRLEQQVRQLKTRAASAEYAGQLIQKELDQMKNSRFWKTTAPVRALKKYVRPEDKSQEELQQRAGLLLTSEYFDVDWYLAHYPDVAASGMNPAEHYLLFGGKEGRLPGPLFDGNWYLQQYPDVAEADINPLLHFVMFGQAEGRNRSPVMLQNIAQPAENEN